MAGVAELAHELMQREIQRNPAQFERPVSGSPAPKTPLNPETLALIGGLSDAASTYAFLKRGSGHEQNAMWKGMGPATTAASVAGAALGAKAIRALLRKAGKGKLADALASVQGANQIGLAALNTRPVMNPSSDSAYTSKVHGAFTRR